jgi:hypothetical protein
MRPYLQTTRAKRAGDRVSVKQVQTPGKISLEGILNISEGNSSQPQPTALTWTSALRICLLHHPGLFSLLQQGDDLRLGNLIPYMWRKNMGLM